MHIIGYIMSYIFRMYMFGIVDVDNFLYTLGQSWQSLTFTKIYRHYIVEWREYKKYWNKKIPEKSLEATTRVEGAP